MLGKFAKSTKSIIERLKSLKKEDLPVMGLARTRISRFRQNQIN